MPDLSLTTPDGQAFTLTVPDNATSDQIREKALAAKAHIQSMGVGRQAPSGPSVIPAAQATAESLAPLAEAVKQQVVPPTMLQGAEDYIGKPLAMSAGAAAGGAVGGPLAPVTAPMGAAAGAMAADAGFEALNRAVGYTPNEMSGKRLAIEGLIGGASVPAGKLVQMAVGKIGSGRRAAEQAADTATREAHQTHMPDLERGVTNLQQEVGDRTNAAAKTTEQRARARYADEKPSMLDDLVGGSATDTEARQAARFGDVGESARQRDVHVGTMESLYQQRQNEFGDRYESLYGPHRDRVLPQELTQHVGEQAQAVLGDAEHFKSPPPKLAKFVKELARYSEDPIAAATAQARTDVMKSLPGSETWTPERRADMLKNMQGDVGQRVSDILAENPPPPPLSVGDVLRMRQEFRAFANHNDGPTRHMAREMGAKMLDTLGQMDVPNNVQLNKEYRVWRNRWNGPTLRALHSAETPGDLGTFFSVEHMGDLWRGADPTQKQSLRETFADWVRETGQTPGAVARKFPPQVLDEMLGAGAGTKGRAIRLDARSAALKDVLKNSPQVTREFMADTLYQQQQIMRKALPKFKRLVISKLKAMGPGAADYVRDLTMRPDADALLFYATKMQEPGFVDEMAENARLIAREGYQKKEPMISRRGSWTIPLGAGELALKGSMGSFVLAANTLVGAQAATRALDRAVVSAMESPHKFAVVAHYLASADARAALKGLSRVAAQGAAADAMQAILQPNRRLPQAAPPLPVLSREEIMAATAAPPDPQGKRREEQRDATTH